MSRLGLVTSGARLDQLSAAMAALEPHRGALEVIIAAHDGRFGPRERLMASAVLRRPGRFDGRYRPLRVGEIALPDEQTLRAALRMLESKARSLQVALVVSRGPAIAVAAERWITAAGPAPEVDWHVEWSWSWYDEQGVGHQALRSVGRRAVRPIELRGSSPRPAEFRAELPGTETYRVEELDEPAFTVRFTGQEGSVERTLVRAASESGLPASLIFERHPARSPLDAMCSLAAAWGAPIEEVAPIGALLRGERARAEVDQALALVRDAHRQRWMFALEVARAVAQGHASRELIRQARARGPLPTLEALRDATGVDVGSAKMLIGHLDRLGDRLSEPGELTRVLERVRAMSARTAR